MQDWRARLKDVALRIEDEIESKVIDSYSGGQRTSTIAESFHSTLEYANEELTKCVKEDLQVNDILSSRERIESSSSSSSLHTASELQSTMVGRTAEYERIKRLLLQDKSKERLVIPILGMAGIEESWDLFLQKIHPASLGSEVKAIWRYIVNYFKGLPFAIVIAAGLARAIIINESLWISKKIERIFYERMCYDLVEDKERKGDYTTEVYEIWRMPMLRHLQFSPVFTFDTLRVDLEYLQTIYWLRPFQCTKQVFLRIPNTKVMGIFIPNEDFFSLFARERRWNEIFEPSDDCFKWRPDYDYRDHLRLNWLKDLINLKKLEKLKINSHHEDPIILQHASAFPVQLRMLTLKGTLLSWHQVEEVIGKLPNLRVLKLKDGACRGLHWELFGGNFPKLKSLLIQGMELKKWTATEDAFTILERLIIKHCYNLKKIPSTFAELYTLRLIELYSCDSLLVHSAKQIQQLQQESIGDNLFGVHDYNTDKAAASIEEKEQVKRGNFEEQERKKLNCKASDPESSNFASQVVEEVDSKLTNVEFFNCFEDDFDNNDIN